MIVTKLEELFFWDSSIKRIQVGHPYEAHINEK